MKKDELSQYFSEMAKKRKNPYFGFKDPEVQRKAQESRKKKIEAQLSQEPSDTQKTTQE